MSLRINTNIEAFNAHRQLVGTQIELSKAMEKLSSGLRINRAADDAAGLAISEKMRAQIRGIARAHAQHAWTASRWCRPQKARSTRCTRSSSASASWPCSTTTARSRPPIAPRSPSRSRSSRPRSGASSRRRSSTAINLLESTTPVTFQVGANAGETIVLPGRDLGGDVLRLPVFVTAFTAGGADITAINAAISHGRGRARHARRGAEPPRAHGHEPRGLPGEPVRRREPHPRRRTWRRR